jgi:hypothetical protein
MTRVAASLQIPLELDEALSQITASVVETVPGIDYASVSVTSRSGRIETLALSGQMSVRADELQYELGEGPCLKAALAEPVVQVDDLSTDPRWPSYVGIVMERYQLDRDRAFEFLVRTSQTANIKLRRVAEDIVAGVSRNAGR